MGITRRNILRGGVAAVVGLALDRSSLGKSDDRGEARDIRLSVTAADGRRMARAGPIAWGTTGPSDAPTITVNPAELAQPLLGFGAAFTEASCFVLNRMSASACEELLAELLSPERAALSVARLCIGASDYSTAVYSYDEGTEPDLQLARFSIEHDRQWVLPVLQKARAVRPDLFLFGSPWSPPAWMKYGTSMLGGSIRPRYLATYANYFKKYLDAYAAAGVQLTAITMQNELGADQDAQMPACTWSEETEAKFISVHLGPLLRQMGMKTQLWIHDHNYAMAGRVMDQLVKKDVRPFVDAVAWHGYTGKVEQMGEVHRAYPDIPMHWTEGGPDIGDPGYETNWSYWSRTIASILHNGCRSITAWNIALDERGGPNVGPYHCGGLVTIDSTSNQIRRSGMFWALSQYAQAIKRGAHIIGSHGDIEGVTHVAAINADGSSVLVLTNSTSKKQSVGIACESSRATIVLPPDSISTLQWT